MNILESSPFLEIGKILSESETPSDPETILASFHSDVDDTKFSPSTAFLESAFQILDERLFENEISRRLKKDEEKLEKLKSKAAVSSSRRVSRYMRQTSDSGARHLHGLLLTVETKPRESEIGSASYLTSRTSGEISPSQVFLNSAYTLTLHEWLEVVLHEMIHILDYQTNPGHFTGYMKRYYDAHGTWFMETGKRFEPEGFHVERYCSAILGINADDSKIRNKIRNSVFVRMKGKDLRPMMLKIPRGSLTRQLVLLKDRISKSSTNLRKIEELEILTSSNPQTALLKDLRMKDTWSKISWWWDTDEFESKYGPFEKEDTVKISKGRINEDKDEAEYDEYSHIDDGFARKMYDNIDGTVDVRKVGDDEYEVSIA